MWKKMQGSNWQHLALKAVCAALLLLLLAEKSLALTMVQTKFNGTAEASTGLTIDGLAGASAVAISPDQQHVYVTSFTEGKISIFQRDATSGQLIFSGHIQNGVDGVMGLGGAADIAVSSDGRNVYVAARLDNSLLTFTRNPATGRLALLDIKRDNIDLTGLGGALSLALSPDRTRLYLVAVDDSSISVFDRNLLDGNLTLITTLRNGEHLDKFAGATDVVVSADNVYIYAASGLDNSIHIFQRSPASGELGRIGVVENTTGLRGAYSLALSPDNNFLYLASNTNPDNNRGTNAGSNESAVVVFARNADGTLNHIKTYRNDIDNVKNLTGARNIAISPHGRALFVTAVVSNSVLEFERDLATGLLNFRNAINNLAQDSLREVTGIGISLDGKFVYTSAIQSSAITAFTTVNADLSITATANAPVGINDNLTYELTITNHGPEPATAVQVSSKIAGTFVSATPLQGSCSQNDVNITCNLGELANGAVATISIVIRTPSEVGNGQLSFSSTVSSGVLDSNLDNNTVNLTSELKQSVANADLKLTVTTNADQSNNVINLGSPLIYTFEAVNAGPDIATDYNLIANLPSGLTFVRADPRCNFVAELRELICGLPGAVGSLMLSLETTAPNTITADLTLTARLQATERDPDTSNNRVTKSVAVGQLNIDLALLDVVATPNSVSVGGQINIQASVVNNGNTPATGVRLNANLPPQFSLVPTAGCTVTDGLISCNLGTLSNIAPNNSQIFAFNLTPRQAVLNHPLELRISGNGTDVNPSNNQANINISATGEVADVVLRIEESNDPVVLGDSMTYRIIITNNGPDITAVSLSNSLGGNNVAIGTISASKGSCSVGFNFICSIDAMAAGESVIIGVEVTPTELGTISLTSQATTSSYDPTPSQVTESTAVASLSADLELSLNSLPSEAVLLGDIIKYTAQIKNNGPSQAQNVVYNHVLPPGVELLTTNITQGQACTQNEQIITCALGPIAREAVAEVYIDIKPLTLGELITKATAISETIDSITTNNQAEIKTIVTQSEADLVLTGQVLPESEVLVDSVLQLHFNLTNSGPDSASKIIMEIDLPAELRFTPPALVIAQQSQAQLGTCNQASDSNKLICNLTGLAAAGSAEITVPVVANQAKLFNIVASVKSAEFDPNLENNSLTLSKQVGHPSVLLPQNPVTANNFERPHAVITSPDGRFVYAAGFSSNSVVVFSRDTTDCRDARPCASGSLTFRQSLIDSSRDLNGNVITGLTGASSLAFSPDANFVYATGFNANAIVVFRRNANNGSLEFVESLHEGQNGVSGLASAFDVVATQDYVYVAGVFSNAIAVFKRNIESGRLSFVAAETANNITTGVARLALSPIVETNGVVETHGRAPLHLYAVSPSSDSLWVFGIDADSGRLNLFQTLTDGLDSVAAVTVSADGNNVYAVAEGINNAILAYSRNHSTGTLSLLHSIRNGEQSDLGLSVIGLGGAYSVAVSPNGKYVYVAGTTDNAVAIFERDANGHLSFKDAAQNGLDGVSGLAGARAVAVSPSGSHVYVAGFFANSIGILRSALVDLNLSAYATEEQVKIGQTFNYNIEVVNQGPDGATNLNLISNLPANVELVSVNPQRGGCTKEGQIIDCQLGKLDSNEKVSLSIVVTATAVGMLQHQVSVTASQIDLTPNNVTINTQVVAVADLRIDSISVQPEPLVVNLPAQYEVVVSNQGPDPATNIILHHQLPEDLYLSRAVILGVAETNDRASLPCQIQANQVTCILPNLAVGELRHYQFDLLPSLVDIYQLEFQLNSDTLDPYPDDNTAKLELVVRLNIIDTTYDNQGQTLSNYTISASGAVIGGSLDGRIDNYGLISDVQILAGARVKGGTVAGEIDNHGWLENPNLASGAVVTGPGVLSGNISGFESNPARIFGTIADGSSLSHVIIGANTILGENLHLGAGVRFSQAARIPPGLELTNMLPKLIEPLGGMIAVDLRHDVVDDGSILEAINALPDFVTQNSSFVQNPNIGQLTLLSNLAGRTENTLLTPVAVFQANNNQFPGVYEMDDGSVVIVTNTQRAVLLQPTMENHEQFLQALLDADLRGFKSNQDGSIDILTHSDLYLKIRPRKITNLTNYLKPLGFEIVPTQLNNQLSIVFRYTHAYANQSEQRREQWFYTAAANQEELKIAILGIPGVVENSVRFYNDGRLSLKLANQTFFGGLDAIISTALASRVTQMILISDANADGSDDVRITYKNGNQQILYVVPMPEFILELQALAELQDYTVIAYENNNFMVTHIDSGVQALLNIVRQSVVDEDKPTALNIANNGNIDFILDSGRQIFTQPLVQNYAQFAEIAQRDLSISALSKLPDGNILLAINELQGMVVRPNLASIVMNLIDLNEPGITEYSTGLNWIFRDDLGVKRQQWLYPAAYQAEALTNFLVNAPAEKVEFYHDGRIEVKTNEHNFMGILDRHIYKLESGAVDGVQLKPVGDLDRNGLADYQVIYADGMTQYIYIFDM